ncbi:2-amino-4-hydroxy-6-hydroxymethyldihydropteridine diphosphokinase [Alkalibacter mobilis]|uniref:2-amino-4-hydroxy-6- hydroxymethyldihydropteridine diphosphokinase n=1 Tax=Alkalibacter mobilis TaxID=2787712 RepID=UPI00189E4BE4|nr:2-amino-4-hydroxy-6-hydroxymethyldihydropteridine diphosphokinase [Alkalibacter mobilis]MBF7096954.1 2-amino-4-hydroxy-6-hydroxymethyldihydropteridine diphosphokinase [Alkalibacter mobilis]
MKRVYLSLGSNMGDTRKNLMEAMELLREKVHIDEISSFYRTEPVGYKDQDWFLNVVITGETSLEPMDLLEFCQSIEKEMKRVKTIRFGPRIIDVDILLYEGYESDDENLTVPHPRMKERAFVMIPLAEIAPEVLVGRESVIEIVNRLDGEAIEKVGDVDGEDK